MLNMYVLYIEREIKRFFNWTEKKKKLFKIFSNINFVEVKKKKIVKRKFHKRMEG